MKTYRQTLLTYWNARTAGERRALGLLAVVLGLAMLGQLLWSAYQGRQALRRQVPELASALETMQQQGQAWQALNAGQAAPRPALSRPEVERRLKALDGALSLGGSGDNQLQVNGETGFDAWIACQAELQRDHGLVVSRLQALPAGPGRISLQAELTRAAP